MPSYSALEPDTLASLGVPAPVFDGSTSFLATSTFLYALFFVAIVTASFYRYVVAGALRIQASESTIRQSNEIIKKVTLGLIGVFSLFILLFTVNKSLVTGDVGLDGLRTGGASSTPVVGTGGQVGSGAGAGSGIMCESKESVIGKMTSSGGVCSGITCTKLSGCNYSTYIPLIDKYTPGNTLLKKMTIVAICVESGGNKTASNKNPDGTYDCGLMQVNQPGACDISSFDPEINIQKGVSRLKEKISNNNVSYPGVPVEATIFSAYNCCSNGTVTSAPSVDCTTASGFPSALPKWACPINPGEGAFNMCFVKKYSCEALACLNAL